MLVLAVLGAVILIHTLVHLIAKVLIHFTCYLIRWPYEKIHIPTIMHLRGHVLDVVHQEASHSLLPVLGSDRYGTDVPVPVLLGAVTFDLSQQVSLKAPTAVQYGNAVLRPLHDVLPIEVDVECLCQDVEVDVVVLQHIEYPEWSYS